MLKPSLPDRAGHLHVALSANGKAKTRFIHQLVAEAFIGPRPPGLEVRHLDGVPSNNVPSNLRYGTRSENTADMVAHGDHHHARKTHCRRGHPYDAANTCLSGGRRYCRTCIADRRRASREVPP